MPSSRLRHPHLVAGGGTELGAVGHHVGEPIASTIDKDVGALRFPEKPSTRLLAVSELEDGAGVGDERLDDLYCVVVGLFAAYAAWYGVGGAGAEYLAVFRVVGAVGIAAYAVANAVDSIWKGQEWSITGKFIIEGVVYALLTAGTFAWLWPEGPASI